MGSLASFLRAYIPLAKLSISQFKSFLFSADFDNLMSFLNTSGGLAQGSLPVLSAGTTPLADIFRTTNWVDISSWALGASLLAQAKSMGLMS